MSERVALGGYPLNDVLPNVCFFQRVIVCFDFTPTVSEKHFLESETGLKIVQSGVGEVRTHATANHVKPLET